MSQERTGGLSIRKPFYGWWMVGALMTFLMFGNAMFAQGFTALFRPLVAEFGWSYTAISLAAAIRSVESATGDVFVGFLTDRLGGRKVILAGALLMGLGFTLMSRVSSIANFYIYYLIVCVGMFGSSSVVGFAVLSHWFRRRLGTAFGVYSAGGGLAGFMLPVVVYLLDNYGFRTTFLLWGGFILFVGLVVAFLVRDRPEALGYGPDGVALTLDGKLPEESSGKVPAVTPGLGVKGMVRTRVFWTLVWVAAAFSFSLNLVLTHSMPYLESVGWARPAAAQAVMAAPIISVFGRLGSGWLGDRFSRRDIMIILMALLVAAVFALARVASLWVFMIPFALFWGLGYGGMLVNRAAILRDYFGKENFGSVLGLVSGLGATGGLIGPVVAGRLYDTTGSYYSALMIVIGVLLSGVVALLSLKRLAPLSKG